MKPNKFSSEKRRKELDKKKKQEEKKLKRLERKEMEKNGEVLPENQLDSDDDDDENDDEDGDETTLSPDEGQEPPSVPENSGSAGTGTDSSADSGDRSL